MFLFVTKTIKHLMCLPCLHWDKDACQYWGKLHLTIINYVSNYTLHPVEGSFYVSFSKQEVGSGTPQNGLQSTILPLPVCAQTLSPSPREDAAKWAYPLFLPQKELFCYKRNFSPVSTARLTFLFFSKTFYYAIKLPVVQ